MCPSHTLSSYVMDELVVTMSLPCPSRLYTSNFSMYRQYCILYLILVPTLLYYLTLDFIIYVCSCVYIASDCCIVFHDLQLPCFNYPYLPVRATLVASNFLLQQTMSVEHPHTCPLMELCEDFFRMYTKDQNCWVIGYMFIINITKCCQILYQINTLVHTFPSSNPSLPPIPALSTPETFSYFQSNVYTFIAQCFNLNFPCH